MSILNTTGYERGIYEEYESDIVTDHDRLWLTDEQIIREIEQAVLKGHGFIITSDDAERLFPSRD